MDDITSVIKKELISDKPNYTSVLILVLESMSIQTKRITDLENAVKSYSDVIDKISGKGRTDGPSIG